MPSLTGYKFARVASYYTKLPRKPTDGDSKLDSFSCRLCGKYAHSKHTTAMAKHLLACPGRADWELRHGNLDLGDAAGGEASGVQTVGRTVTERSVEAGPGPGASVGVSNGGAGAGASNGGAGAGGGNSGGSGSGRGSSAGAGAGGSGGGRDSSIGTGPGISVQQNGSVGEGDRNDKQVVTSGTGTRQDAGSPNGAVRQQQQEERPAKRPRIMHNTISPDLSGGNDKPASDPSPLKESQEPPPPAPTPQPQQPSHQQQQHQHQQYHHHHHQQQQQQQQQQSSTEDLHRTLQRISANTAQLIGQQTKLHRNAEEQLALGREWLDFQREEAERRRKNEVTTEQRRRNDSVATEQRPRDDDDGMAERLAKLEEIVREGQERMSRQFGQVMQALQKR